MGKRSRQFRRVSGSEQDYRKQIGELDAWDKAHGYEPSGTPYVSDGKSAFHGKQIPDLERAVADMEAGAYEVLTFWAADRMWRGESLAKALTYVERIHAAGGKIEFVKDPHLNIQDGVEPWVRNMLLARAFGAAHAESARKSQRAKMDLRTHQETGAAHGRAPWGWAVEGPKDAKRFVPTDAGRQFIPQIYERVVDGWPLERVSRWLESEGAAAPHGGLWQPVSLMRLVANPINRGERRNGGTLEVEALVPSTVWQEAQAAMASRLRRGRSASIPKPLVMPVCGNCYGMERPGAPGGVSPMYRVHGKGRRSLFRCWGTGPRKAGCGTTIPVDVLEERIRAMVSSLTEPHMARVFHPGDDHAQQVAKETAAAKSAIDALDFAAAQQHMAEAERLRNLPHTKPRWTVEPSGSTVAKHFASLDVDGQRDYLARWDVVVVVRRPRFRVLLRSPWAADGIDAGLPLTRHAQVDQRLCKDVHELRASF